MFHVSEYEDFGLHADKYAINMAYAAWKMREGDQIRAFDLYYRHNPFQNGYGVFIGLERVVRYLSSLTFSEEDIAYLKEQEEGYEAGFYDVLRAFRFTGDVYAVKEGSYVFPNVPLMKVIGSKLQVYLIEAALLGFINFQTLIGTKAARIRHVAQTETLLEMGLRRAHEADASIWGARAAYLTGFDATSNMRAGKWFGIPTKGTMSHAWVQDGDELEQFRKYAQVHRDNFTPLVDTYDTLRSGIPNAIIVAKELEGLGHRMKDVRIDSGDLAYQYFNGRAMLDDAGLGYSGMIASGDLDEQLIVSLKNQGVKYDKFGIGTKLSTAYDQPSLGGVYKLVAKEEDGVWIPTIKISGTPEKVSTPGNKAYYRIFEKETGKYAGDYITLHDEIIDPSEPLTLYDPQHTFAKVMKPHHYEVQPMLQPIFKSGQQLITLPSLTDSRQYHAQEKLKFWSEYLRTINPARYRVSLSDKLYSTKQKMIQERVDR
ncbi:nicotinate phosphoribosyltransferase [Paenibacillus abyssi]|uniref:Nicotinate phosphoribosyltransferase n=1 Tax=Paenibacillus abyssi TaxID=1340531 RepID=A0A917FYV9_9BACL|nr:nicotinate phosphoribosyltransferase [Paenibacillus abyssi]GGG14607.1 nicotinate phosphoribosyltransferase [Paenibacillus abyssi]